MKKISNIREILLKPLSRNFLDDIIRSTINDPDSFHIIYSLIWDRERKVSWRATWACEKISDAKPEWFGGKEDELISLLLNCNHDGMKRILLSILYKLPTPEPVPVNLLDFSLQRMLDLKESAGVQSLCIKMAYKLCIKEPDLLYELKVYLENAEPGYYSVAVRTCLKNILRRISCPARL